MINESKAGLVPKKKEYKFEEHVSFSPEYTIYSLENQLKTYFNFSIYIFND